MSFKYKALSVAVLGVVLSACGSSDTSETPTTPSTKKALAGVVVDPYISGADVKCGSVTVKTDSNGKFKFEDCSSALTVTGGTDTGTGLPFTGTLQYPTTTLGNVVITPLTTIAVLTGTSLADLTTKLGVDVTLDPMTDKKLLQVAVAAQQLIVQLQNTLTAAGVTDAAKVESGIKTALTNALKDASADKKFDLTKTADLPIAKLITDAAKAADKPIAEADAAKLALVVKNNVQEVNDAIAALPNGAVTADSFKKEVADVVKDATDSKPKVTTQTNYVGVTGLAFGSTTATAAQILASSAASPIATSAIDQVKVTLTPTGTAAADAKLAVSYEVGTKSINFVFDKVNFTYADGKLASFKLPANSEYNYEFTSGTTPTKGKNLNVKEDSFTVENGTVTFSLNNLLDRVAKINNAFKAEDYKPKAEETVKFTVALDKAVVVNGVDAPKYTIVANAQTLAGNGVQAVAKVQAAAKAQ